jgi:heterodisulfide reductase subunit A
MSKTVAIIGGGIAGIETSIQLEKLGYEVNLYEKDSTLGGHAAKWDRLFPNRRHANEVIDSMTNSIGAKTKISLSTQVSSIYRQNGSFEITANGATQKADAVVLATGFELFPANRKEEYGYGIFDNVITSAELEKMFAENGKPLMTSGKAPEKVAIIHCVGSRDEKVNRPYCSKVCCVTAVKQAIEVKEAIPSADVYCFYMDLRMFGPGYEELYKEAQVKGVTFIRGRLSETIELEGGRIQIKSEDTLASKPLKMSVDMVVLMVGMSPQPATENLLKNLNLEPNHDGFVDVKDYHLQPTHTSTEGVFVAGACTGPNNITDSVNAARSAAIEVHKYLTSK